jgi:cellulose synthase operon protein C
MKTKLTFLIILILGFNQSFAQSEGVNDSAATNAEPVAVKNVSQVEKQKNIKAAPAVNEAQPVKLRSQGEEVASEVLAAGSEQKAIEQLKILLQKYKGTPTEASLLFRLAELYMNKARSSRVFEMFQEESKDGAENASASFIPKNVVGKEKLFILEAVKVYEAIEDTHPDFNQMDAVIYNNGYAHLQAEMKSGAELVFTRMLKNKKLRESPMIPDALLALGEIAFQANNFPKGLAFFELIRKYPESKVYPYGIYKSSWCHYNMKSPENALSTMEEVVAIGHKVEKEGSDLKLDIRKEALSDMALFYSEAKASDDAIPYFIAQAKNINPTPYLERLSKIYNKHGKIKDEEMILLGLVKEFPKNPRRPFFFKRLAETYDSQNRLKEAVINLVKFDRACDEVIATGEKFDDPEVEECKDTVDSYSIKVAKDWVKRWKKENSEKHAIAAEQALRVHLREQEAVATNSEARYVFADVLFHLQKYAEASTEYEKVGKSIEDQVKAHDARYAALVAHDKAVNGNWDDVAEVRLKVLAEEYLVQHPKGVHYLDVSFKVGLLDYTKEKLDLALPRFYLLGQRFPAEAKGQKSQDLYLDILNRKKDYIALQKGALEWKSLEKDPKRQASLQVIFEQAYFSHVQVLVADKKYDEAITLYREFATNHSYSDLADEAQWNIVDLFFKKEDFPGAAAAYFEFYKKFPKHEKAVEGLIRSADLYEQMSMPSQALEVTKILSTADSKNVASWLLLSGDFYAASGKYYQAINEFKGIFLDPKFANPANVTDIASQAIDRVIFLSDQLGAEDQYYAVLREMAGSNVPSIYSPAISTYAESLKKNGKDAALGEWLRTGLNRNLLAEDKAKLNYLQGTLREKAYLNMKISDASMDALTRDIDTKSKLLSTVQSSYQAATKGGDAYTTVNSLVGLAGLYQGFVTSLNSIEGPSSFAEDEKMALKDELSNIVFPFEEKAVETIDAALKFARKSDLRDGSIGKIQRILDNLNMKKRNISSIDTYLPGPVFANDKSDKGAK